MPDAAWAVNGYPPGSSQGRDATLVPTSSHCVSTRQRQRTLAHRSSSRPVPDAVEPRLSPRRSAQRSSANAPVGGLKPPPEGRLQRAKQPPSLLQHHIQRNHHLPIRPASCVRVHNISRAAPLQRSPSTSATPSTLSAHRRRRSAQTGSPGTPGPSTDRTRGAGTGSPGPARLPTLAGFPCFALQGCHPGA